MAEYRGVDVLVKKVMDIMDIDMVIVPLDVDDMLDISIVAIAFALAVRGDLL